MIKERADKKKYMCFSVDHTDIVNNKEGTLMFAGFRHELIFARKDNFEGMLELYKYRDNFKSASRIRFEIKKPNARVCDGVIPPSTTTTTI